MNTGGPTYDDMAGPQRTPQVIPLYSTCGASTTKTVVAAPGAGKRIVVLSLRMVADGATPGDVTLKSGAGGTIIWGDRGVQNVAMVDSPGPGQLVCACAANTLLEVNNGNNGTLQYNLRYIIEAVP